MHLKRAQNIRCCVYRSHLLCDRSPLIIHFSVVTRVSEVARVLFHTERNECAQRSHKAVTPDMGRCLNFISVHVLFFVCENILKTEVHRRKKDSINRSSLFMLFFLKPFLFLDALNFVAKAETSCRKCISFFII